MISDTHGWLDPQIFDVFRDCDEIWHAGDWGSWEVYNDLKSWKPLRGVFGNVDSWDLRRELPEEQVFSFMSRTIWITHIAGLPPKYETKVIERAKQKMFDILICGHTHVLKVYKDPRYDFLYINPGAGSFPLLATFSVAVIEKNSFENI